MQHGYVLSGKQSTDGKYRSLKKCFLKICKTHMYNKTILYLDDKASIAARAFLSNTNRKVMSLHDLKEITKTFGI